MAKSKKRKQKGARNMVILGMILHCHGGAHKPKNNTRAKQNERAMRESES